MSIIDEILRDNTANVEERLIAHKIDLVRLQALLDANNDILTRIK